MSEPCEGPSNAGRPAPERLATVQTPRRAGRQPASSRAAIEHAAFRLFDERGFELTTVDDIAEAAGIARRTFFSYFASKNDVPWGSFEQALDRMRCFFADQPGDVSLMDAVRLAVLDFNTVAPGEEHWHRRRLSLILSTPALQAHSTLRYTAWREVINDFAATRLGLDTGELTVQVVGYTSLATAIAAYEVWLAQSGSVLHDLLDNAFSQLTEGLGAVTQRGSASSASNSR